MIALYIILGIILFLVLVLCIPIGVSLQYDAEVRAELCVAFLRIPLYPPQEKKKKKKKKAPKKKPEPGETEKPEEEQPAVETPAEEPQAKKKGENPVLTFYKNNGINGVVDLIVRMNKAIARFGGRLARSFTFDELYIDIIVAKGDAARTAEEYGKLCAVAWPAFGYFVSSARVRKYNFNIQPDFLARYGEEAVYLRFHVTPLKLINAIIMLVFALLFKVALKFILSSRKSGPKTPEQGPKKQGRKPAAASAKPADGSPAPAEESPVPAEEAPAPAEEGTAPGTPPDAGPEITS